MYNNYPYVLKAFLAHAGIFAQCLCVAIFLAGSFSYAMAAKASLTFSYAPHINGAHVALIVQSLAYKKALQEVSAKLRSQRALSFALPEKIPQMALVAELYTVHFSQQDISQKDRATVSVQVELTPRHTGAQNTSAKALSALLAQKNLLQMRLEWLTELINYSQLGKEALLMASGIQIQGRTVQHGSFDTETNQVAKAAQHLEALWIFHEALQHFQHMWQEPKQVAKLMQKALHKAQNMPLLWTCLGEVQLRLDHPQDALKSLNTALSLDPMRGRALYIRALAHLRLQQPSLAKVDANTALALEPENGEWLQTRGAAFMLLEDYEPMCQDFAKACAFGQCQGLQNARKRKLCLGTP